MTPIHSRREDNVLNQNKPYPTDCTVSQLYCIITYSISVPMIFLKVETYKKKVYKSTNS